MEERVFLEVGKIILWNNVCVLSSTNVILGTNNIVSLGKSINSILMRENIQV